MRVSDRTPCRLSVNGDALQCLVSPMTTLCEALRYELGLTGTKQGCDKGDCGACTGLIDGQPRLSCITLALSSQDLPIVTIEGLADMGAAPEGGLRAERLHELQDAFDRFGAAQCGFCTPGILMSSAALLVAEPAPTRDRIKAALSGNLCRCTGYTKILDAVEDAARRRRARLDKEGEPRLAAGRQA